jgi:hypothetical protein
MCIIRINGSSIKIRIRRKARDRDRWQAVVMMVMNIRVSLREEFLE